MASGTAVFAEAISDAVMAEGFVPTAHLEGLTCIRVSDISGQEILDGK